MRIEALSGWTREQKHVVAASFLGWTLDAFDFFLLVFVLKDIAQEFNTQITDVTFAILLHLGNASNWGIPIWAGRRPVGTSTHSDGRRSPIFDH